MILKPRPFRKPRKGHWATKDLVGFWPMLAGSGNKVFDLSGNNFHGTSTGLATRIASKFGSGYDFDGVTGAGEISIPNVGTRLDGKHLTIVTWINWNQTNDSFPRIIDRQYNGQFSFYCVDAAGELSWALSTVGGDRDRGTDSTVSISKNVWMQAVLTYDGTAARVYVDSVLRETYTGTIGGGLSASSDEIIIGEREDGSGRLFDGQIDHVIIWDRALSASEIALLYQEPFCMFERDPIELWSAATIGAPPVGAAGIMTTNTGYWGPTF